MELEQTDQEQVEVLQQWWRDNWLSLLGGLVVGLGGILGWQYYGEYSAEQAADASVQFEQVKTQLASDQRDEAQASLQQLSAAHGNSPYVAQAQLALAQSFAEADQWTQAQSALQSVLDHSDDPAVTGLARLRLARAQWAQGDADAALASLNQNHSSAYAGLYAELMGDIARSQGDTEAARSHWQTALTAQPQVVDPQSIQQKLDTLP